MGHYSYKADLSPALSKGLFCKQKEHDFLTVANFWNKNQYYSPYLIDEETECEKG